MEKLTDREKVLQDVIRWKIELEEVGSGNEFTDEDIEEYRKELEDMDYGELVELWQHNVGEWIASRDDVHREWERFSSENPDIVKKHYPEENVVNWQFDKLLDENKETDYGYIHHYQLDSK
jgi:hypothetical protein